MITIRRIVFVLGVCIVVGAGVAVAFLAFGGTSKPAALPTTGAYAPLTIHQQTVAMALGGVLSNPEPAVTSYLSAMMSPLPGRHHYRLTITNTSSLGFINSFQWYPPAGVRVVKVTGSTAGHCSLNGLSGFGGNQFKTVVLYPNIRCNDLTMKPPSCTCTGDGGSVSMSIFLDRDTGLLGGARMISATPVLKVIRSYLGGS